MLEDEHSSLDHFIHTTLYKMEHTACEQVLTVILVRQQHVPGCSFQKGSQEKSEQRRAKLPSSLISLPLLSVISCHYSGLLMTDPERQFISLLWDTRCMSSPNKELSVSLKLGCNYSLFAGLMSSAWSTPQFSMSRKKQTCCHFALFIDVWI